MQILRGYYTATFVKKLSPAINDAHNLIIPLIGSEKVNSEKDLVNFGISHILFFTTSSLDSADNQIFAGKPY